MVAVRAHAVMEVHTMITLTPVNDHAHQIVESLLAHPPVTAQEPQSRLGPPLGNGDNGESTTDSRLGSPLETGDNGNAQIDANERRLDSGSPIETAANGKAQIGANERRLDLDHR
jgi:hypothetical protein